MLAINLSFRRMIKRYVPNLTEQTIINFESYVSLRHQLQEENRVFGQSAARDSTIQTLDNQINNLVQTNYRLLRCLVRLYSARRSFALQHGHHLQIPATSADFSNYIQAAFYLLWVEVITYPVLVWGYFQNNAPVAQYIVLGLVVLSLHRFLQLVPQIISTPVSNANLGDSYSYQVVAVDSSTVDKLTYTLISPPGFLSINSATGFISGTPSDTGSYMIKVIVSDMFGASDVQDYQLKVDP